MPRPKTESQLKKLCSGCRNDRYNHKGMCERPGIDAIVTSDKCWSLAEDKPVYSRQKKCWFMSCHTGNFERYYVQWAETKQKPSWNWWR